MGVDFLVPLQAMVFGERGGGPQCQIDVISTWIQCMHVFARACGGVGPWNSLGLGGAVFPRGQRLLAQVSPSVFVGVNAKT